MKCNKCNNENIDDAKFCAICESNLENIPNNFHQLIDEFYTEIYNIGNILEDVEINGNDANKITFSKYGTGITLEISYNDFNIVIENNGNEFCQMQFNIELSYLPVIRIDIPLARKRISFINAVCLEAAKIRDKFLNKKIYHLTLSAENKKEQQTLFATNVVRQFIMVHGQGLKVGESNTFYNAIFSPHLVLGEYSLQIDNKYYIAEVIKNVDIIEVTITRGKNISKRNK